MSLVLTEMTMFLNMISCFYLSYVCASSDSDPFLSAATSMLMCLTWTRMPVSFYWRLTPINSSHCTIAKSVLLKWVTDLDWKLIFLKSISKVHLNLRPDNKAPKAKYIARNLLLSHAL